MVQQRNNTETQLLAISTITLCLSALLCTVAGLLTSSQSLFFDGISSSIGAIISVLILLVARLISYRENSRKFQFGFWHFEPLVILVEGGFLALVAFLSIYSGIKSIMNGGHILNLGLVFSIEVFFAVFGFCYSLFLKIKNRTVQSRLIHMSSIGWAADAVLSLGLAFGFAVAWIISGTGYGWFARYMDSIALVIASVFILIQVAVSCRRALLNVLGVAPRELDILVRKIVARFVRQYNMLDYYSYVEETGRQSFIEIYVIVPEKYRIDGIEQLDQWRREIYDQLQESIPEIWVSITFTCDRSWAE